MKWCSLSDKERNINKLKLTVTYDMVWKKISSGGRYESSTGNSFIFGGIYKVMIGMVLYSKYFLKCDTVDKRGEEAEEHELQRNTTTKTMHSVAKKMTTRYTTS